MGHFNRSIFEEGGDALFHRRGPDAVTGGGEVEEIGHDGLWNASRTLHEAMTDVQVLHPLPVLKLLDSLIDLQDLASLVVEVFSTREDTQKQDLCLWKLGLELMDHCSNAIDHLIGRIAIVP